MTPVSDTRAWDTRARDTRSPEPAVSGEPYWNRPRLVLVALVYLMAVAVVPLAHAYLSITNAVSEPDTLDDFACLSCHAANRGHIAPPDRSCLSCHPMDFGRHLATARAETHVERAGAPLGILVGAYATFCLGALLFVLRPISPARILFAAVSALALGGVIAGLFGGRP